MHKNICKCAVKTNLSYPGMWRGFSEVLRNDARGCPLASKSMYMCVSEWPRASVYTQREPPITVSFLITQLIVGVRWLQYSLLCFVLATQWGGGIKNQQEIWEAQHYFPSWQEEFLASFEKSRVQARHSHHRGKRQPPTYQLNPIFDPTVPEWWSPLPLRLHTLPLWPHTLPRWASHLTPRLHTLPLGLPTSPVSLSVRCAAPPPPTRGRAAESCVKLTSHRKGWHPDSQSPAQRPAGEPEHYFKTCHVPSFPLFLLMAQRWQRHTHIYIWNTQKCIFVYSPFLFFSWLYFFLCTCAQRFFFSKGDIDYPFVAEEFLDNPRSIGIQIKQW